jgi:hypothetical protein
MPAGVIGCIPIARETTVCLLQATRQCIFILGHSDQMDVIGHQAIADEFYAMLPNTLLEQIEVDRAFRIRVQNEAPRVAALGDVVSDFQSNNASKSHHFMTCIVR